jgi:hypothetical protein
MRNSFKILTRRRERKRLLGRSIRRWEDNDKLVLKRLGLGAVTEFISLRAGSSGGL